MRRIGSENSNTFVEASILLIFKNACLYILELTVGLERNLSIKTAQKANKYQDLTLNLRQQYNDVKLISLSISTLSIISSLSTAFIEMLKEIKVEKIHQDIDICHYNQIYLFHLLQTRKGLEYSGTIDLLIHAFSYCIFICNKSSQL